jgi:hypothetical protein
LQSTHGTCRITIGCAQDDYDETQHVLNNGTAYDTSHILIRIPDKGFHFSDGGLSSRLNESNGLPWWYGCVQDDYDETQHVLNNGALAQEIKVVKDEKRIIRSGPLSSFIIIIIINNNNNKNNITNIIITTIITIIIISSIIIIVMC